MQVNVLSFMMIKSRVAIAYASEKENEKQLPQLIKLRKNDQIFKNCCYRTLKTVTADGYQQQPLAART